jgi:hypothetical protein
MDSKMSVLEKLKQLDEQRSKLLEDAKAEALSNARKALDELNALGFNYALTEEGSGKAKKGATIKRPMKDAPCPICKFKTTPLHDARAHRSQEAKKPFTKAELAERGLDKVA